MVERTQASVSHVIIDGLIRLVHYICLFIFYQMLSSGQSVLPQATTKVLRVREIRGNEERKMSLK